MAKDKGLSVDFKGFENLAYDLDKLYSGAALLNATEDALTASKNYVNAEIEKAIDNSKYNFDAEQGYSSGDIKRSFEKVKQMPVEVIGTVVTAFAGIDTADQAEEILFIIYGTPTMEKDTKLYNAVKVKGKVKKEVEKIQRNVFTNALGDKYINGERRR